MNIFSFQEYYLYMVFISCAVISESNHAPQTAIQTETYFIHCQLTDKEQTKLGFQI